MGLLDDAIREHLELKRRGGADPGEVARAQREALDPVPRDARAASDEAGLDDELALYEDTAAEGPPTALLATDAPSQASPVNPIPAASADGSDSSYAQETAELDMQAMLDEERDVDAPVTQRGEDAVEDSLEWEVPGRARDAEVVAGDDHPAGAADPPELLLDPPDQEHPSPEHRPPDQGREER